MNKKELLKEFIGRRDTFCVRQDGKWLGRVDGDPMVHLEEHLEDNGYDIGCYNIYGGTKNKDGEQKAWCKWICIDIDAHPPKVVNKNKSEYTLYIGRPSKWGNPFTVEEYGRDKCIELYEEYVRNGDLINDILELEGEILGCFCKPEACHGDILAKIFTEKKKEEIGKSIRLLYKYPEKFLPEMIEKEHLIIEETENGYHIWILLEDGTWASDAWKLVNIMKPNINKLFGTEVEFFPKQDKDKFYSNEYGNQVKLPLFGGKENIITDQVIIKKLNLKSWRKELNKRTQNLVHRKSLKEIEFPERLPHPTEHEKGEVAECLKDLYNMDDWILGRCIKNVLDGTYQCEGHYGHLLRVATANELLALNKTPEQVVQGFKNQKDYNPKITYDYVTYSKRRQDQVGRDLCFQCATIRSYGFCDPDCGKNGTSIPISKVRDNIDKPLRGSILTKSLIDKEEPESWDEVFTLIHKLIRNEKGSNYIIKTTRSGTTTATIAQCIQDGKNVLMIAPTKLIYESTVEEGKDIWFKRFKDKAILYPKTVRIGSNIEECLDIRRKFSKQQLEEIERVFPFLIKRQCDKCPLNDICGYMRKIRELETNQVIFLTTQKFKAIAQMDNMDIFNELIEWADIVFIDEFSALIDTSYNSRIIFDGESNINSIPLIKGAMETFMTGINIKDKAQMLFNDFIYKIKRFVDETLSMESIENVLQVINTSELREEILGDEDLWNKIYSSMLKFFLETEDESVKYVIMCFFAIFSNTVYIQLYHKRSNKDGKIYPFIELAYTDDMNRILDIIKKISRTKYVLMTDATIPYLEPHVIFEKDENEFYVRIGDPNRTNEKQEIIVIESEDDMFYYLSDKYKEQIDEFISLFKNDTFIIAKNKSVFYYVNGKEFKFDEADYYRGSKTIGVKNDLRSMAVLGSSRVPRHSFDCMAKMYKDAGYFPELSYVELGQYLENHNARSHFFQSISRVKDPLGRENSRVVIYGMRYKDVVSFLHELDLGTFVVKKVTLQDYIKHYT